MDKQRSNELPATATAAASPNVEGRKRPRRRCRDPERTAGDEGVDDAHGDAKRQRSAEPPQYQEVLYKGTTRAVFGPGCELAELLFGEESASLSVSASVTPARAEQLRPPVIKMTPLTSYVSATWPIGAGVTGERFLSRLQTNLSQINDLQLLTDTDTKREGVRVAFSDDVRKEELCALLTQVSLEGEPLGEPFRVTVVFELCASIEGDIHKCFRESFDDVRRFAQDNGVAWKETAATSVKIPVEVFLESHSRETLEHVEAALHGCVESDVYDDPFRRSIFKRVADWQAFISQLTTLAHEPGCQVSQDTKKEGLLWVFGPSAHRRGVVHRLRLNTLSMVHDARPRTQHCAVCSLPAKKPSIVLTACNHTCCVDCIPQATSASSLPLRCPAAGCCRLLDVKDITAVTNDLDALVKMAVAQFVTEHAHKFVMCPKSGCGQVLRLDAAIRSSGDQPVVTCDNCEERREEPTRVAQDLADVGLPDATAVKQSSRWWWPFS